MINVTQMENQVLFDECTKKMSDFFRTKGFIEVHAQSHLSILAACEDPYTVATFEYNDETWPLPQTNQMNLENILLKNPNYHGVFCQTTSYRNEPNPIEGRHEKIFPMFEFECAGTITDLLELEKDLLSYLGFDAPVEFKYEELCEKYNTPILNSDHEIKMMGDFGHAVSLQYFPERTSPFWNMKHNELDIFNKVDVILFGQETIGSAERSVNPEEMKYYFETISDIFVQP